MRTRTSQMMEHSQGHHRCCSQEAQTFASSPTDARNSCWQMSVAVDPFLLRRESTCTLNWGKHYRTRLIQPLFINWTITGQRTHNSHHVARCEKDNAQYHYSMPIASHTSKKVRYPFPKDHALLQQKEQDVRQKLLLKSPAPHTQRSLTVSPGKNRSTKSNHELILAQCASNQLFSSPINTEKLLENFPKYNNTSLHLHRLHSRNSKNKQPPSLENQHRHMRNVTIFWCSNP